ncbi:hypothetical protein J7T55_012183 [Diaporthe amygdali]|uniref:uncharacterized protein n=1 Tax=Phomopsis amygdali TaxID=1214568 RepID=UPI0022FE8BCA|nr:uncharacterized protein J7T55_012183 [Diaporthe amygdali]KAJ0123714.1 hypothetical protein J7T55_012183 [Diaporthe amygdali]
MLRVDFGTIEFTKRDLLDRYSRSRAPAAAGLTYVYIAITPPGTFERVLARMNQAFWSCIVEAAVQSAATVLAQLSELRP